MGWDAGWGPGRRHGPTGSAHGRRGPRPEWWPADEAWPPRSGDDSAAWSGFRRRAVRSAVAVVLAVILLPLALGVLLAATIGGWASVAVALVTWVGLLLALIVVLRSALRWFRPARDLITATDRLADGDHAARVASTTSSPFGPVVRSFNRMANRLEEAEGQRRQLLADIGHELRTPLTVIRGDLEAMADGVRPIDAEQIRVLLDDVSVMERLLEDLRTLSISEAGQLALHCEPTDLHLLVSDVVDRLRSEAEGRSVDLRLDPTGSDPVDGPVEVLVDPVRLKEVTSNLVINGLRAAEAGDRVTVGAAWRDGEAVIEVADTGRGIPPDELDRVFDRFHKGADSPGSGLGLTISRDLVEAHGGTIELASTVGEGTTVTVRLPGGSEPVAR